MDSRKPINSPKAVSKSKFTRPYGIPISREAPNMVIDLLIPCPPKSSTPIWYMSPLSPTMSGTPNANMVSSIIITKVSSSAFTCSKKTTPSMPITSSTLQIA